ncbi:MAG: hypothetical protein ABEJ35_05060 [Halobacteriaceae archaeon]
MTRIDTRAAFRERVPEALRAAGITVSPASKRQVSGTLGIDPKDVGPNDA